MTGLQGIINFPETAYLFLGVMISDGDRFIMLSQLTIKGENPTKEEIDKELLEIGFNKDRFSYWINDEEGNLIRLSDTHTGNFFKTKEGRILCIDSVFEIADR